MRDEDIANLLLIKDLRHPVQPIGKTRELESLAPEKARWQVRFKPNAIVRFLLDENGKMGPNGEPVKIDLHTLAFQDFSIEDRVQFAQLIGYSLTGFAGLSYVSDEHYERALAIVGGEAGQHQALAESLLGKLDELKESLRQPMADLFGVHPDDLMPEKEVE